MKNTHSESEPTCKDAPLTASTSAGGPAYTFGQKIRLILRTIQARLRFIAILLVIGAAIGYWDTLKAYYAKWTRSAGEQQAASSDTEFFCPMHPQIIRDNAKDKCPICFMPLSKRKKGGGETEPLPAGVLSRVQLSPYRVVLGGVQTIEVTPQPLVKEITTVGFVEFDERRLAQIAARVKGRLDKVYVNVTGQMVSAGDKLASLYSPELVVTVNNLLDAKRSGNEDLLRSTRERLRLWDISDDQVDEILRTGKADTHLVIRSPISGHVIKKYQTEGKYVDEGMTLYEIADLSTVWIQAQVYEDDIAFLKPGVPAVAKSPAIPNKEFPGTLSFIHPHLDQATRTLTVRFDVPNPDHELRPGMYANVTLKVPMDAIARKSAADNRREGAKPTDSASMTGEAKILAIPESAVVDTGARKIVYREASPGVFEGVEVALGPRAGTLYPVLSGLTAGDRVATSGSFLIDAETRLNPAAGSIYFGGSGGSKTAPAATTTRASTPSDEDAEVTAVRAKLPAADRRLVDQQDLCPVLDGSRLGSMGKPVKVVIENRPVFLCCKGCEQEAKEHAKETLVKVEKLKSRTKIK